MSHTMSTFAAFRRCVAVAFCLTVASTAAAQTGRDPIHDPVNPQEIERLRQQIAQDSTSHLEILGEYHHETGELNDRLQFWRYGARVNLRPQAGALFSAGVVRTLYLPRLSDYNSSGTNVTVGFRTAPSDTRDGRFELGVTFFGTDAFTVNGLAHLTRRLSDQTTIYVRGARANVEESLLSATGLNPVLGPFAGELTGAVMENRFTGGVVYQLPYEADVFGEGSLGNRHGSNVDSNFFRDARAGAGINLFTGAVDDPVTSVRASYEFHYYGFADDRSGFGGASMESRRGLPVPPSALGGDGISPVPTATHAGVGGYFSPGYFVSNVGRVELRGVAGTNLEYRLAGFLGSQSYTGSPVRLVNGVSATAEFPLADRLVLPISYYLDNLGPFVQQSLLGTLRIAF
jgi:hypothetical protein